MFGRRPSAVGTLVERHSRYVLLFPLPDGCTAERMRPALTAAVLRLPLQLRRSLTGSPRWLETRSVKHLCQFHKAACGIAADNLLTGRRDRCRLQDR